MELAFNRIDDLRELVSRRIINLDFRQIGDGPFHCRIKPIVASADARAVRWLHSPGMTLRDRRMVADGDESISLIYPVNSTIIVSHLGYDRRVSSGQSVLLRHNAIGHIGARQNGRYVAVIIPSAPDNSNLIKSGLAAQFWPDEVPALKLLKAYLSVLATRPDLLQEGIAASAGRHIADLVRAAANEMSGRPAAADTDTITCARLNVALAFLQEQFRRPDLSVATVADAQKISPRYLHRLFERGGIRFTEYVSELRLNAAHAALTAPGAERVSSIALDAGFSDIAHFNRLFKKRFGVTPSVVRSSKAGS